MDADQNDSDPSLATKDALRRLAESGSDLSQPMEVEFHLFVPDERMGELVAGLIRELGMETELWCDEETGEWTCTCYKTMLATYESITEVEQLLEEICTPYESCTDGWGTYGNAELDENRSESQASG